MATTVIRGLYNFTAAHQSCVATVGNFDGVHIGHQALLQRLKESAKNQGVKSLVLTFEPQPLEFFAQEKSVPRLTRWREKMYHLSQLGIDKVLVMRFNALLAALTAEEFLNVLSKQLAIKHLIVGEDFHFGYGRKGDVPLLKKMDLQLGFTFEIMPSVAHAGERVSSTWIRQALLEADHATANQLLGRPYFMMGRVVHGDQRGRILGFPTANINVHRHVTPVLGIYIVKLHGITKTALPGVASVGVRPTVDGTRSILEVHIFNFNENIYGRYVRVEFCKKLRDEKRFDNLELLKEQIWKDAELARNYFNLM